METLALPLEPLPSLTLLESFPAIVLSAVSCPSQELLMVTIYLQCSILMKIQQGMMSMHSGDSPHSIACT